LLCSAHGRRMAMLVLCLIFSLGRVFAEEDLQDDYLVEELLAELDSDPPMAGSDTRKVDTQLDESVFNMFYISGIGTPDPPPVPVHHHNPHHHDPGHAAFWAMIATYQASAAAEAARVAAAPPPTPPPHSHSPHGHSPHGHSPHIHTPYPTPVPTTYPTPSPTNHICETNQHNCDTTVGGVCYRPGAADYAGATTDHDMGVNGVNEGLDANFWVIPAHSEHMNHDTSIIGQGTAHNEDTSTAGVNNADRTHVYKCGCKEGYNCVAGCSPPFAGHKCEMTKYPTPYPTSNPTPAPTAMCPVTCELEANMLDRRSHIHDAKWNQALVGHADKKVKVTHNVHDINTQDTYTQHRCYRDDGECLCECIDSISNIGGLGFFEEGAQAGHMHRAHPGQRMPNQGIFSTVDRINPQLLTESKVDDPNDMVNFWATVSKRSP